MKHPIYKVRSCRRVAPFTLEVRFNDNKKQTIDFQPILEGELYGPLKNSAVFNSVRVDPEIHTLVWPNGADFDPAILHNWPKYNKAYIAAAKRWQSQA